MKSVFLATTVAATLSASAAMANFSPASHTEAIKVELAPEKLDASIPAEARFMKFEQLALKLCDQRRLSLEDRRFERQCAAELKRSIIVQLDDDALKSVARERGIL